METAISALIIISVLVLTIVGLAQFALNSQAQLADASRLMQIRLNEQARTGLTPTSAGVNVTGDYVFVTLKNTGSTKLADFSEWDVLLQYQNASTTHLNWFPFGSGRNQWNDQIYMSISPSTPEVIEPGILNPGEYITFQIWVSPTVSAGTTNIATIATPTGITASTVFTR